MRKKSNKKKMNEDINKINKKKKNSISFTRMIFVSILIIIFVVLILFYRMPIFTYFKSKKNLAETQEKYLIEEKRSQEITAQLNYINTPNGIKYLAKVNGFYEPGEVMVEISDIDLSKYEKYKNKFFAKRKQLACSEHTVNNKFKYNPDCVICQKINKTYQAELDEIEEKKLKEKESVREQNKRLKELNKEKKAKEKIKRKALKKNSKKK